MPFSGVDNLMDVLHEIGRCGCKHCHADPHLIISSPKSAKDITIEFEVPDRKITATGSNINEACQEAIKNINVRTGVK